MLYKIEEEIDIPVVKPRPKKSFQIAESSVCDKPTHIYALCDPVTNECRYVGKSVNAEKRFKEHCRTYKKSPSSCWIKSLKPQSPVLVILETIEVGQSWPEVEQFWITYFKFLGARLTNLTNGGEGHAGHKFSKEALENMSKGQRGKYMPPMSKETRDKISAAHKGKKRSKQSEETIAKRVASRKDYKHSEETKEKQSKAAMGKPKSKEACGNMSIAQKALNRKITPENRAALNASLKGVSKPPLSQERKEQLRISSTGRKQTPESIQKMLETRKRNKELSNG